MNYRTGLISHLLAALSLHVGESVLSEDIDLAVLLAFLALRGEAVALSEPGCDVRVGRDVGLGGGEQTVGGSSQLGYDAGEPVDHGVGCLIVTGANTLPASSSPAIPP